MRLSCLQENFSRGLAVVGRAVATRTTLPITQNVHISTDRSQLKLSATNLEIAISTWVGAQIEEEGSVTIPARILTEFVNSIPQDKIDLRSGEQPASIDLECARFEAHINGTDAESFPPIPSVESGVVCKVAPKALRDAINHVAFAAATEESRPVLTGIKVEISGDEFTFAAADGFRLAVYTGKLEQPSEEDLSFIIPSRALQEISRLIGSQENSIELTVTPSKSQALFRLDNIELVTQLIEGSFPNYSQLIPKSYDTRAVVSPSEFRRATKAASIFARDGSGIVRINVTGNPDGGIGKIAISSKADELGENLGEIDAKVEGEDARIALNNKYLEDVLDVFEEDEIALEITSPSSPGVLKPVSGDQYVHVVMPMFVQW